LVFFIAATAIFSLVFRPRRFPEFFWPLVGASLVVALGYEPIAAAAEAIARQWNILLFILGLMVLSATAEESGAFRWLTELLLERARGSPRRLFIFLFLAGAVVTIFFSNDATAIALTPVVYRAVAERGVRDAKPFLLTCIFIANTASFGLPFSNPANVLILPHARLLEYVWHLGPPQIVAIALNLGIFLFFFRSQLRGRYDFTAAPPPSPRAFRTLCAMGSVALAYVVALLLEWPLGPVAAIGAALVLAVARIRPGGMARRATWSTLLLLAVLFVLFNAVTRAGFVSWALGGLDASQRYGSLAANAIAAGGAALLSNAFNNLPIAVASSYVVAHAAKEQIAYPLIAGVDLGPNLMTSGSLATILWLGILRRHGVRVGLREYLRLGVVVVPATIAVCLLWLYLIG
jgi:arsenical pump membrane protein